MKKGLDFREKAKKKEKNQEEEKRERLLYRKGVD